MKLLGYLSKLMVTAILLSTLSVMTTIYIVDQYVGVVLDRFSLSDIERPALSITGVLQSAPAQSAGSNEKSHAPESQESNSQTSASRASESEASDAQASDSQVGEPQMNDTMDGIEAAPVFGYGIQRGSIVITADEFNEKRKNLSDEDKMEIFAIMMNKLPQAELQKLSEWLEDGITDEELTQVEEVINAYLEEDDIDRLLSILNRY